MEPQETIYCYNKEEKCCFKNRCLAIIATILLAAFAVVIGLIIGVIVVICKFTYFFVNLAVMIGFGFLGMYVQRNKSKVKETLKNIIDKM